MSTPKSKDPDEMRLNAAFYQGLCCLLRLKQFSGKETYNSLVISTFDTLKYIMGSPIFTASICMGKSIRIQRVNYPRTKHTLL